MKSDFSFDALVSTLEAKDLGRRDYVVDSKLMNLDDNMETIYVGGSLGREFNISETMHTALATRFKIPSQYYFKCLKADPRLLSNHVQHWMNDSESDHMIRTMNGTARTILSPSYRIMDALPLIKKIAPIIEASEVLSGSMSCGMHGGYVYINYATNKTEAIALGDEVAHGVSLRTNEIGLGSEQVAPLVYRLVCTNGMIALVPSRLNSAYTVHRGPRYSSFGDVVDITFDYDRECANTAHYSDVTEKFRDMLSDDYQDRAMEPLRRAAKIRVHLPKEEDDRDRFFNRMRRHMSISSEEMVDVIDVAHRERKDAKRKNLTGWDIINGVTETANKSESIRRANFLQRAAWKLTEDDFAILN